MPLKHIRLELARCPGYPEGSRTCGYEFSAPLKHDGHLDVDQWRTNPASCAVRRFWDDEEDRRGHLVHVGRGWRFHYDGDVPDEDEPLYKLDGHQVRKGEYLSITEHDGTTYPFRVVSVA